MSEVSKWYKGWTANQVNDEAIEYGESMESAWRDAPPIGEFIDLGYGDFKGRMTFEGCISTEPPMARNRWYGRKGLTIHGFTVVNLSFVEMLELITRYRNADVQTVEKKWAYDEKLNTRAEYSIRCFWE